MMYKVNTKHGVPFISIGGGTLTRTVENYDMIVKALNHYNGCPNRLDKQKTNITYYKAQNKLLIRKLSRVRNASFHTSNKIVSEALEICKKIKDKFNE